MSVTLSVCETLKRGPWDGLGLVPQGVDPEGVDPRECGARIL